MENNNQATNGTANLVVEFFESADHEAALEYFGGKKVKWYSSDFSAELHKVDFGNIPESVATNIVLFRIGAFLINQSMDKIPYPDAGLGYNSNSWTQSVIEYSSGKGVEDFKGLDVSNSKRILRIYFDPVCTVKPFITTTTFGRGGFFIHGGSVRGSIGCIDLTSNMNSFSHDLTREAGLRECQIHLTVDYP